MAGTRLPVTGVWRVMSSEHRHLAAIIAGLGLLSGLLAGLVLLLPGSAAIALAGSPSPTTAAAGDPRSSGQGPGLVGDPLAAIVLVAAIALASVIVTLAYVRLTGGTRESNLDH